MFLIKSRLHDVLIIYVTSLHNAQHLSPKPKSDFYFM